MKYYTYIVECSDATLYTGYTNDLDKRMKTHNEGKGAKYTKVRRPVRLVYFESFDTKSEAMSREYHIKRLSRREKIELINNKDTVKIPKEDDSMSETCDFSAMEIALEGDLDEILSMYAKVIEDVNKSTVKLGWNIDIYPDRNFVSEAIEHGEMCILRDNKEVIAAAVINNRVNPEYDDINWTTTSPKEKIATIHALAVASGYRGAKTSYRFLQMLEEYCRKQGYVAIHLDVIDTNIPAYKLYMRNGYKEMACIEMFYEVVGTRQFWMLEHELF